MLNIQLAVPGGVTRFLPPRELAGSVGRSWRGCPASIELIKIREDYAGVGGYCAGRCDLVLGQGVARGEPGRAGRACARCGSASASTGRGSFRLHGRTARARWQAEDPWPEVRALCDDWLVSGRPVSFITACCISSLPIQQIRPGDFRGCCLSRKAPLRTPIRCGLTE